MFDGYEFALCLTHDVDRPFKTYQAVYDAVVDRDPRRLAALHPDVNPYWQFEDVMAIESDLGVRSSFYFLDEQHLLFDRPMREWVRPRSWIEHLGRYDLSAPEMTTVIRRLHAGGWEVGLHGSYHAFDDRERLAEEKRTIEEITGHAVLGGRQHYLHVKLPETWRHYAAVGLKYDASLGSSDRFGFGHGYGVKRPFGDDFVVFPLTAMEVAVMNAAGGLADAKEEIDALLEEAAANDAVMTVLWHPRYFAEDEFPGYRELYIHLVEQAAAAGAWIGPPGELYSRLTVSSVNNSLPRHE